MFVCGFEQVPSEAFPGWRQQGSTHNLATSRKCFTVLLKGLKLAQEMTWFTSPLPLTLVIYLQRSDASETGGGMCYISIPTWAHGETDPGGVPSKF